MPEKNEFYTTHTEVATKLLTAGNDHHLARVTHAD